MGRDRQYGSDADRQRAYRKRKADEWAKYKADERAKLHDELFGIGKSPRNVKAVSAKLVKVLGMLGSDYAGERDVAARKAMQILKEARLTWYDVLDVKEPK